MLSGWWKRRRRRRLLETPVDSEWEGILRQNVRQFSLLSREERDRLLTATRIFLAEKNWEGCGGQKLTDEIRVTISGHACLMLLGWEGEYFDRLKTILVYPDSYVAPHRQSFGTNTVLEWSSIRLGEAWYGGPVIISWAGVPRLGHEAEAGLNVVIHEFAHVLDMLDTHADGVPPMHSRADQELWKSVLEEEYERLVEDAETGRAPVLDEYGAESHSEFFAVSTECFFEQPVELASFHPRLYDVLSRFYRQDPARWWQ